MYDIFKALHIIFIVTWFAGLFYMFRLFVYHVEVAQRQEPDRTILLQQLRLMEKRLWYIITWPSAILTLIFGPALLVLTPDWLSAPWMHLKLFFVMGLVMYQFFGQKIYNRLAVNPKAYSSFKLRLFNEIGTLILVAVVFLVVLKDTVSWVWGSFGLVGLGFLMAIAAKWYKKSREKRNS